MFIMWSHHIICCCEASGFSYCGFKLKKKILTLKGKEEKKKEKRKILLNVLIDHPYSMNLSQILTEMMKKFEDTYVRTGLICVFMIFTTNYKP